MTRVHYDRLPWLPRGRNGSRVQRANHQRRHEWQRANSLARSWPQLGAPVWVDLVHKLPAWMIDPNAPGGPEKLSTHYGLDGKPIGILQASLLMGDEEVRRIGLDVIGEYEVSTVFLPDVVHRTRDGRPLLFETLVWFKGDAAQRWLTTTKQRAEWMHVQVCNMVQRDGLP